MKIVVIGSGFAGATFARIAAEEGHWCTVYEARPHLGGNSWDCKVGGFMMHAYGPHYFRTNNHEVVAFLSRFTEWRHTTYRVLAWVRGRYVRFPINLGTYEDLYGLHLSREGWEQELARRRVPMSIVRNAEEKIISQVGDEFYRLFYEGYSRKQWGLHPRDLLPHVVSRIPVRKDETWRYVDAEFQALPKPGYATLFERLLYHPRITVKLATPWDGERGDLTIYTGPLDAWFRYRQGRLPYRSLTFRTEILPCESVQPCGQVNYPDFYVPYTRSIEWKHITGETGPMTLVTKEFPQAEGEPFYPMPTAEAKQQAAIYKRLASEERGVVFIGRLATYQYLNMDEAVSQAMQAAHRTLSYPSAVSGVVASATGFAPTADVLVETELAAASSMIRRAHASVSRQ